ncbi:MAG: tRNA preQ1(34) S-adenosylmethionine ribosyltransferase-isomerase QueA [Chloroflexi bacterium RBG_13_56_8]|nr:MAG: tRNA preQ1(34) S-adenosylmethionine ribosyltransferase-isomerase QueA [Chloroflexi bacterium RBG_13_56_8]
MLTREFDYDLPAELIAQVPVEPRDASRLLVLHRAERSLEHRHFHDVLDYLNPGDLLVANESRVIPARLFARKVPTGGRVELLLLSRLGPARWEALVRGRKVAVGQRLRIGEDENALFGVVEAVAASGGRVIRFDAPIERHIGQLGVIPLPPYIHQPLADPERYQTVYACVDGSVAAPTAGLHFTPELVQRAKERGMGWATVVLHISLDTFRPVTEEVVEEHRIHTEYCHLSAEVAQRINATKAAGHRVIAVGTTSVRVLETAARNVVAGVEPWDGPTDLFIYPGYRFRVVDALITNFHLPRSSLLMLVSAFAGTEQIQHAYREAIRLKYRFYSLGDSMLIL